jgi:drug/metabolite transporter (DMT)-like permease
MDAIRQENLSKAIVYSVLYGFCVSILSLFAKLAAPHTTDAMIVFFRFGVCVIYLAIMLGVLRLNKQAFTFKTQHIKMHIFRAFAAFGAQFALFYSLRYIPIMDANTLLMTHPVFVLIISVLFLGFRNSWLSWLAIIVGFIGIVLTLKPGHEMFQAASLMALLAGFLAALSLLGVHEVGKYDNVYTIMFYYFGFSFIFSGIFVVFSWQTPSFQTLIYLLAVGALGTFSQECSIRALLHAPAKIVAPLMYSTIIFSGILDWCFWKHTPDFLSIIGIVAIFMGGTLTVMLAKKR